MMVVAESSSLGYHCTFTHYLLLWFCKSDNQCVDPNTVVMAGKNWFLVQFDKFRLGENLNSDLTEFFL